MASAALQSLRRRVTIDWPKIADEDARQFLIRAAQAGHDGIMRQQSLRAGVVPEWSAYANTPGNTNLQSVRLPGPIVYQYRYFREIVLVALRELAAMSPVESGRYRQSHTLYVDGVAANVAAPSGVNFGQTIIIANPLPYARRLEIGKTESGRNFLISVENRIYEREARSLARRYGSAAKITFGYANIPGAHVITGTGLSATYKNKHGRVVKRRKHTGEKVDAPAIFIEPLAA